ncbi:hypothetical protein [Micromonospora sp. NBC_01739]|uniref:hypothetical protein n=1 Tax=Micromonospora sp. NBC_01739 TaxID=2975985 RepID=UPI002E0F3F5E|nr:hypothetical protein OIE53_03735 [Micromonospora sp. NBC_01739]
METALRADEGASAATAPLNKILNGLNTQLRPPEALVVGSAQAARIADAIGDWLNKILTRWNKIIFGLNVSPADRLRVLNKIAMRCGAPGGSPSRPAVGGCVFKGPPSKRLRLTQALLNNLTVRCTQGRVVSPD